ncbi:hypothetical protein MKW94_004649 [Papaver nudicaule]|uniref:Uncharacterized protein n=1 Tax=Papaver nudicaule TaxID=74823 RepID=A0AA41W371_PAPNU|nr:hypothetical protein [Papaver nudicaule]
MFLLLGEASSCIFLTLSLRLIQTLSGFFLILHVLTIGAAISGCAVAAAKINKKYATHMVAIGLTAVFQGAVSVLIFSRTDDFLGKLHSYVMEKDAS